MVTFDKEKQAAAHKELHKKIYDCDCKPWARGTDYCTKCSIAVIEFMNDFGAGCLTRDSLVDDLVKENSKIKQENKSLSSKLESKIKRVEELKAKIKSSGLSISINSDIFNDV